MLVSDIAIYTSCTPVVGVELEHALRMRMRYLRRSPIRARLSIYLNRCFLALNQSYFPKMSVCLHYLAIVVILCCGFVDESSCQTSLSSQDQQELLNAHNHYRGLVNPTASNMQRMVRLWRYWQISNDVGCNGWVNWPESINACMTMFRGVNLQKLHPPGNYNEDSCGERNTWSTPPDTLVMFSIYSVET